MQSQPRLRASASRIATFLGGVALVSTAACASAEGPATPEERPAAETQQHEGRSHRRSPALAVLEATREHADLSEEQHLALDEVEADLEGERDRFRAMHDDLKVSAVRVVRSAGADRGEVEAAIAAAVTRVEENVGESMAALEEIHGLLDADQRFDVAEAMRAHLDERFGPRTKKEDRRREGFKRFASYLVLSPEQVDQLLALQKEMIGEKKELKPSKDELYALVDAFEGESFGEALDTFRAGKAKLLRARITKASEKTETVLAIFTPGQRDLLADLILEGPTKLLLGDRAAEAAER
jgi:hypothetical protein